MLRLANVSGLAAKASTDAIPIVFIVGDDPVNLGLVSSLNRPGGNATGISVFTTELGAKRLEILRQLLPNASTVGLLINSNYPGSAHEADEVQSAAKGIGQAIVVSDATTEREIEQAFATFSQQRVQAALVSADALFVSRREEEGLKKVIAMDWDRLIAGHPGPGGRQIGTKDDARNQLAYLQDLSAAVKKAVEEGKSYADAEKEIKLPKYEKWGNYEPFLQMNIERYYDFHNRGI